MKSVGQCHMDFEFSVLGHFAEEDFRIPIEEDCRIPVEEDF